MGNSRRDEEMSGDEPRKTDRDQLFWTLEEHTMIEEGPLIFQGVEWTKTLT